MWPDPLSIAADVFTIIGIPAIAVANWNLYLQYRESRKPKIVSDKCLEFLEGKTAVNLVPFDRVVVFPRPGDTVLLPGETHEGKHWDTGKYEVKEVDFCYDEAPEINQPCPAVLGKVVAHIRKRGC